MEKIVDSHYKLNITLLSSIGLWPYANKRLRRTQNTICVFLLVLILIPEILMVITSKYTMAFILYNISPVFMGLASFYKYCTFLSYMEKIKHIMEEIKFDWNSITDYEEIKIIEEKTSLGKMFTKVFAFTIYPSAGALILSPFASDILDILVPLNETRPHKLAILFECFIDNQKYFYVIAIYFDIIIVLICTIFVSTESTLIMWMQHAAGLSRIVSYRIKEALNNTYSQKCAYPDNNSNSNKTLQRAADLYRRSTEFLEDMKADFLPSYLILLLLGVAALIINLFRVSQSFLFFNEIKESMTSMLFVFSVLGYIFYMNYATQMTLDSYNSIFDESYCTKWYERPLSVQKLLLLFRLRMIKCVTINVYGMYSPSLKDFSKLLKVSLSYFMALVSYQ